MVLIGCCLAALKKNRENKNKSPFNDLICHLDVTWHPSWKDAHWQVRVLTVWCPELGAVSPYIVVIFVNFTATQLSSRAFLTTMVTVDTPSTQLQPRRCRNVPTVTSILSWGSLSHGPYPWFLLSKRRYKKLVNRNRPKTSNFCDGYNHFICTTDGWSDIRLVTLLLA